MTVSITLTTYRNALGLWLPISAAPTDVIVGSGVGALIVGTSQPDAILSYGGGSTIYCGTGDETIYTWDYHDTVVAPPNAGVDTVICYDYFYSLALNVDNLVMEAAGAYAIGNAGNNIIEAAAPNQVIEGGGGNDILVAASTADTFLFGAGSGNTVIQNFQDGGDYVAFKDTLPQFTSFAAVRAAMTQSGSNVVLNLGSGGSITFANHVLTDFTSADFKLPPNLGSMMPTFSSDFTSFDSSPNGIDSVTQRPVWQTTYELNPGWMSRTLAPGNPEVEFYSDPTVGVNPFTVHNGTLDITAAPAASGTVPSGLSYTSGMISTEAEFSQLYGYFEIRAEAPSGGGFWPAFWLLPANYAWPPEIDILEASGSNPNVNLTTVLSDANGTPAMASQANYVTDMSAGFHTYGLSWRPDMLRFYVDGREVFSTPTPADMNSPMYLVANLAVGGVSQWPGPADGTSSATMAIDYIHAYQYTDIAPVIPQAQRMQILTGTADKTVMLGGKTEARIEPGAGYHVIAGGSAANTYAFGNFGETDVIMNFRPGIDKLVIPDFTTAQITTQTLGLGTALTFGTNEVILYRTTGPQAGDVIAAPGDNWIVAGVGNQTLTGAGGPSSFVFAPGDGHDQITNFVPGFDRLVLEGVSQASLHGSWATVGGNQGLLLSYGTGNDNVFLSKVGGLTSDSIYLA